MSVIDLLITIIVVTILVTIALGVATYVAYKLRLAGSFLQRGDVHFGVLQNISLQCRKRSSLDRGSFVCLPILSMFYYASRG